VPGAHCRDVGGRPGRSGLTDLLVELGADVPAPPFAVLEPPAAAPAPAAAEWVAQHGAALVEALKNES
jgi:FMN reductase